MFDHGPLYICQPVAACQCLDGINFLAGRHRQEHQAAIHWTIAATSVARLYHHNRTGPAFPFGTTFFGSGKARRSQKVQQSSVQRQVNLHRPAIDDEFNRRRAGVADGRTRSNAPHTAYVSTVLTKSAVG